MAMMSALGSHRFNPLTGLWELVSLENATGFEMSLPMMAEVAADGVAVGPVTALPEPVTPLPSDDGGVPDGFRPPTGDALVIIQVIELWVNSRTGERFYAGTPGWTNDDPDWVNVGAAFGTPPLWDDAGIVPPGEPVAPVSPPDGVEGPGGQIIIGGPIHSLLTGGDGNDLMIAGASAGHEENWVFRGAVCLDPTDAWPISDGYVQQGMHGSLDADRHNSNGPLGDTLNGGLGRDTLIGNDLSNDMNGGAGADVMIGGGGADIYWVDDAGDMVMEYDHGGRDVVYSSVSYTLSAHVEKLVLALRAGDINGTGNELDNILIGNLGRNVLSGGAGDDWLNGASGGDTLIGGDGEDVFAFGRSPFSSTLEASMILDFEVGVDTILIDLPNTFTFEDPWPSWLTAPRQLPAMRQEGADTIITLTVDAHAVAQEIRLVGVDMHLLSEVDFGITW
jgi:hypothetical protein